MKKYSKVYKVGRRYFRYNYERAVLECIVKETAKRRKENEEWAKEGFTEPLWDFVDGVCILDSIGLMRENWKESPEYWCERYAYELDIEMSYYTI